MKKKKDSTWILLSIIGMVGFLYTIKSFDLDTQIYIGFYVLMIIAGLSFFTANRISRKYNKTILLIYIIVFSLFIGLYNLI